MIPVFKTIACDVSFSCIRRSHVANFFALYRTVGWSLYRMSPVSGNKALHHAMCILGESCPTAAGSIVCAQETIPQQQAPRLSNTHRSVISSFAQHLAAKLCRKSAAAGSRGLSLIKRRPRCASIVMEVDCILTERLRGC